MPTIGWLIKKPRASIKRICNVRALKACPQKKGLVIKARITKPKKPNSAQRKIAKIRLSNGRFVLAKIPGQGHNLRSYSIVLVRGGRANDLPGVRFTVIRGKFDFSWKENFERTHSRSKYGIPRSKISLNSYNNEV